MEERTIKDINNLLTQLFQKMHEAGYEWNTEMKELKKIHVIDEGKAEMDYCFTKMMNGEKVSSAWSEEDEEELDIAISTLKEAGQHDSVKWLKSLKERVLPQPKQEWSDEDESIALGIEQIVNCASLLNIAPDRLNKVRDWLKSLNERVQPKEELSEENARLLDNCISLIEDIPYTEDEQNWLKSLRPQPKKEWSEEDEELFTKTLYFLDAGFNNFKCTDGISECKEWLQSIKQRKSWKPSDKQLTELRCAISGCSFETSTLIKLEEDLKRLL